MEKYIGLLNPSKLKSEFLFDLFLVFSPEKNKNVSLRNWNYIHLHNGHNVTYNDIQKGRKILIQNEDETYRECKSFEEILNLTKTQYALINKVDNMLAKNGLLDVIVMLNSFNKKGLKRISSNPFGERKHEEQYKYTDKDGNEKLSHAGNLPNAHFRWNFGERYILTEEDLNKIERFIKPLVKYL